MSLLLWGHPGAHVVNIRDALRARSTVARSVPPRSNIFQRLVLEIHRDLGPGWTVTESRMRADQASKTPREIDILAETSIGGYSLRMGIEAVAWTKRAGQPWVEQQHARHRDLNTHKLVLWSRSGFTPGALAKAKHFGIDCVTPTEGITVKWADFARSAVGSILKYVRPAMTATAVVPGSPTGAPQLWPISRSALLRDVNHGREVEVGTVLDWFSGLKPVGDFLLDHAREGSGTFQLEFTPPHPTRVVGDDGREASLEKLVVEVTTRCEIVPVRVESAFHEATVTTLAEAELTDGTLRIAVREKDGARVGSASLQSHRRTKAKTSSQRKRSRKRP